MGIFCGCPFFAERKNCKNYNHNIYRYIATTEIGSAEYNLLSFRDQIAKITNHRKYSLNGRMYRFHKIAL